MTKRETTAASIAGAAVAILAIASALSVFPQSNIWTTRTNGTTGYWELEDTTNSKTPLTVETSAPSNAIYVDTSGDVGIGTSSPSEAVHVTGSDASQTFLKVENTNSTAQFAGVSMDNIQSAYPWDMSVNLAGQFRISLQNSGVNEFLIDDGTGNVTIENDLTVNGTFSNPSSRTLKTDIEPVDRAEALERLASLPINEWSYTADNTGRRHIGPFTEDFGEAFGLGTQGKNIVPLDVQGVTIAALQGLTKVVQEQQEMIKDLQARLAAIEGDEGE